MVPLLHFATAAMAGKPKRLHWARHHRVLAGVLIVLILVGAGLVIAQDQETLRIRSSVAVQDPRFPDYLARLLGHQLTTGDSYIVHTNGDAAFPAMLAAIGGARQRVEFESYIYQDGDLADRFTSAFEAAARRGVAVRVVVDSFGSSRMSSKQIDRLKKAGVLLGWVNPLLGRSIEEANYRSHRKALVVDGRVAFVGGMGIADQWIKDEKMPRWRDTQIELHGPVVGDIEAGFNQNWILTGGTVDPQVPPEGPSTAGKAASIVVWSAARSGANELKLLYLLAIAGARHHIDIESPYLITDESSQWSLSEARRRGVTIRMLVEGDKTDAKAVKFASRGDYEHLLEMGIELAEYQPTMMHAKAMVIDGLLSIIGSANFDNRSLELNDELNVAVFDPELAGRLEGDFERDLTRSKRLSLEAWRSRPIVEKGRDWLLSYFGEVL
ncbi:MAG TPA: phospholipase D-like domain-containing protein [Vicinamibacterales bacterium]|nr:phospholipase D-like domain-containing protein [Vicinamibacterales bacterium]